MRLGNFNIYCIHSFFATCEFESYNIAFADVVNQTTDVYKNFLFRGIVYNKAKSFGFIEELHCSLLH